MLASGERLRTPSCGVTLTSSPTYLHLLLVRLSYTYFWSDYLHLLLVQLAYTYFWSHFLPLYSATTQVQKSAVHHTFSCRHLG